MNRKEKIFKIFTELYSCLMELTNKYWGFVFIIAFLFILDFYSYSLISNIPISNSRRLTSFLFTISYISFFISILLLLKEKVRKIITSLVMMIIFIIFLINTIYFDVFNSFFSFNNLVLANEGSNYFDIIFQSFDINLLLVVLSLIILFILSVKFMPKYNLKTDILLTIFLVIVGIGFRYFAILSLGNSVDPLAWDAWSYKKNIYNSYTDTKKSMKLSGFYEYIIRDFYLSSINKNTINKEEYAKYLSDYFSPNELELDDNDYGKIFKDKNVIIVMMETIDSWLATEETMPHLYNLMSNGINFTNHFSVIYGGGATFNTEFMINTGYMTPFNSKLAAYSYTENVYSESLVNLFKKAGYSVNNFHFNYGTFYNRSEMSKAFGYDNYISALEMGYGEEAKQDSLVMNDETLKNLFLPDTKFMTYFTTYSAHVPYAYNDYMCNTVANKFYVSEEIIKRNESVNCIKLQARETDEFYRLLLENLKEKGIYDNTVIIGVSDHYAYTFPNQNYVKEQKNSYDENFIHNVPFFIWSSDIENATIDKVNSNLDILPTIASLFDLDYNPSYYLGSNILSEAFNPFVFFADYSWYDGNIYYKDGKVIFGDNVTEDLIKTNSEKVNNILDINTKVLETNYFAKIS